MIKKTLGLLILTICSISLCYAKNFSVTSMEVTSARIEANFFPPMSGGGIDLNLTATTDLVGGYIDAITQTMIGQAGLQTLYTSESNLNPYGESIDAGMLPGGPVPTGSVNMKTKIIHVDMTSLFSAHGPMDQNIGGMAMGVYHPGTGEYTISWSSTLTQGKNAGKDITVIFSGTAEVKPN